MTILLIATYQNSWLKHACGCLFYNVSTLFLRKTLIKRVIINVVSFLSFSRYTYILLQTYNFNVAVNAGKNALLSTE